MTTKEHHQEHMPMSVTNDCNQPETGNIVVPTTTSIVETTNKRIKQGERLNWSSRVVYLLSIIGFVVDLGKNFFLQIFHSKILFHR